jgi:hypothetical protein
MNCRVENALNCLTIIIKADETIELVNDFGPVNSPLTKSLTNVVGSPMIVWAIVLLI